MDNEFSPNPEGPVLVIGGAGIDMIGRLSSSLQVGISNPAQIRSSFGGVARNIAENLARLGQPVTLISAVGVDRAGDQLLAELVACEVDVSRVMRAEQQPTGTYLAVVDNSGALELALDDMRAVGLITPDYLRSLGGLFSQASAVFIDGNLSKESIRTIISMARRAHIPLCADPTSAVLANKLLPYIKNIQMLTPNYTEACVLTGREAVSKRRRELLEAAKQLVSQGVSIVSVVIPNSGVVYATSETTGMISAIRTSIVDPTGAGDALSAAILFGLLSGMPVDDAVRLGAAALSLTMGQVGSVVKDLSLQKLYDHLIA